MTANLLDHLQEQGYEPDSYPDRPGFTIDQYDLVISGIGTVRVCIQPDDGYSADVYVFDGHMCTEWEARFTPGAPDAAIIAVIEAAEWQLAARRGGPVTPAQQRNAS